MRDTEQIRIEDIGKLILICNVGENSFAFL